MKNRKSIMINCKPFNAKYLTPATCIRHHQELKALESTVKRITKNMRTPSKSFREQIYPARYYVLKRCINCKIGLKHYKASLKNGGKKTASTDWNERPGRYRDVPGFA